MINVTLNRGNIPDNGATESPAIFNQHYVFAIDRSSSMRNKGKLKTVKSAMKTILTDLLDDDYASIITYNSASIHFYC